MSKTIGQLTAVIDADDQLTPKLYQLQKNVGSTARQVASSRAAFRQLAYGLSSLGTMAVGLGVSLQRSNNEMVKSIGNNVLIAGTFLSGIASALQFITVIQRMTVAWKNLTTAQIIARAFSGPVGWTTLGIGAAVAVGTIAASRVSSSSASSTGTRPVTVINNIQGSVVTEKQLTDTVRRQVIQTQQRNGTSGIN